MGTDPGDIDRLMARFSVRRRELFLSETPSREIEIKPFSIDRTEVTNGAFRHFDASHAPNLDNNMPVTNVTWDQANGFCKSQGKRLPTEAEWEFAASGGKRIEFPWGDEMPDNTRVNWSGSGLHHPMPVASFLPNGGLYDMAGNVWEFTADRWRNTYDSTDESTERYVIRGGSYDGAAINLRVRYRDSHPAANAVPFVGFRCAQ